MAETQITGAMLEQAIQTIGAAVDWSDPPESDTISIGARVRNNDQSLAVLIACARQAFKTAEQENPTDGPAELEIAPEIVTPELLDVNSNGDT